MRLSDALSCDIAPRITAVIEAFVWLTSPPPTRPTNWNGAVTLNLSSSACFTGEADLLTSSPRIVLSHIRLLYRACDRCIVSTRQLYRAARLHDMAIEGSHNMLDFESTVGYVPQILFPRRKTSAFSPDSSVPSSSGLAHLGIHPVVIS